MGADDHHQPPRADAKAAFGEERPQTFDLAAHAPLRGVLAYTQGLGHLARRLPLEIAQQHGVAVRLGQLVQRRVQVWRDVVPERIGFGGKQIIHNGSLLFARAAAHIGANGLSGDIPRRAMQPTRQHSPVRKLPRLARQRHEHPLGHVLRQVRITHHPHGGGIDQVNVPAHQFGKRRFRPVLGVVPQKLLIGQAHSSQDGSRRR